MRLAQTALSVGRSRMLPPLSTGMLNEPSRKIGGSPPKIGTGQPLPTRSASSASPGYGASATTTTAGVSRMRASPSPASEATPVPTAADSNATHDFSALAANQRSGAAIGCLIAIGGSGAGEPSLRSLRKKPSTTGSFASAAASSAFPGTSGSQNALNTRSKAATAAPAAASCSTNAAVLVRDHASSPDPSDRSSMSTTTTSGAAGCGRSWISASNTVSRICAMPGSGAK